MTEPLLRLPEVAKVLGVSRTQVYNMARRGELPCIHLGPKLTRVAPEALRRWIEEHP